MDPERVACHVFAREVGESGTPHLQGYIRFKKPCRLSWWKNTLPRLHVEARRGTEQQAWDYCLKDGDVVHTQGQPMATQQYPNQDAEISAVIEEIESGSSFVDIRARHKVFVFKKRRLVMDYMKDERLIQGERDPLEEEFQREEYFRRDLKNTSVANSV